MRRSRRSKDHEPRLRNRVRPRSVPELPRPSREGRLVAGVDAGGELRVKYRPEHRGNFLCDPCCARRKENTDMEAYDEFVEIAQEAISEAGNVMIDGEPCSVQQYRKGLQIMIAELNVALEATGTATAE